MKDLKKQIEEAQKETENNYLKLIVTVCPKKEDAISAVADLGTGFKAGAKFVLSKESEILFNFFIWFRENGEKYVDRSIESMIEIYLKERSNG